MKKICISVLFFISFFHAHTQSSCGVIISEKQRNSEIKKTKAATITNVSKLNKTFEISIFIIKKDTSYNSKIKNDVAKLNTAFAPSGFSFLITSTQYINSNTYDSLSNIEREDLILKFQNKNTINIYYVSSLQGNVNGFSYMPADGKDCIFIQKSFINTTALIHYIGHFFGLYETSETSFGQQPANNNNCTTVGDLICDTPGDPGLSLSVDALCNYNGNGTDGTGKYYAPSVSNYMSDAPEKCKCYFTLDQYKKMILNYQNFKINLR